MRTVRHKIIEGLKMNDENLLTTPGIVAGVPPIEWERRVGVLQQPEQALRYNQGKLEYSMLDLTKLSECVKVLMFGKQKYARDNWKKGMPTSQIIDSMMRHLSAIQNGEILDPESGLSHLGHLQCNALFLGNGNNTQDVQVLPTPTEPTQ
jgi:hypothetical protein